MAGYKYMLSAFNYIKNVVPVSKPIQNPLCLPSHPLINPNGFITQQKEICTDCPSYDNLQKFVLHDWNDKVLLLVGTPKGIDENIIRLGIKEGVKQIANLDIDKANGEALQHMLCHEYKDGNKVKYINCDKTNELQLTSKLQMLLTNHINPHVIVNTIDSLSAYKSQEEIDSSMSCFTNSCLTAFNLMRTDNAGMGGAFINMVPLSPPCPHPDMPVCTATKSMDIILSSTGLDHENLFLKTGVRIMTVCYGASDSDEMTSIQAKAKKNLTAIQNHQSLGKTKPTAQAVIDIFKFGNSGTTWLSRETKVAEDITHVARRPYNISSITEPKSQRLAECN